MDKIYVFGHLKPDTDSTAAAIAMSHLYNKVSNTEAAKPYILGIPNPETRFALDFFNIKEPEFLNDVRVKIKDLNYRKGFYISERKSIYDAYRKIIDHKSTGIPIVDDEDNLLGLLRLKGLTRLLIDTSKKEMYSSFDNILGVINGEEIVRIDNEIKGNIKIGAHNTENIERKNTLCSEDILILGNRLSVIKFAILSKVKLIIITEEVKIDEELIELAKKYKVNIIKTIGFSYDIANKVYLSNYISNFYEEINSYLVEDDFLDEFLERAKQERHSNYPVVDIDGKCLGLIRFNESSDYNKKKVILVDHQEQAQSVHGIEQAEILEVIDHHKIGDITTNQPINFRNMAVGCTCTIIYLMFKQFKVEIPKDLAGIMLSAILSDTLMLKSPTSTKLDEEATLALAKIVKVDYKKFAKQLFQAAADLKGKTPKEIIQLDFKEFDTGVGTLGVGQIFLTDFDYIKKNLNSYIKAINEIKIDYRYAHCFLFVTDITNDGSFVIFSDHAELLLKKAFKQKDIQVGSFIPDILSRKKQIIPNILSVL